VPTRPTPAKGSPAMPRLTLRYARYALSAVASKLAPN